MSSISLSCSNPAPLTEASSSSKRKPWPSVSQVEKTLQARKTHQSAKSIVLPNDDTQETPEEKFLYFTTLHPTNMNQSSRPHEEKNVMPVKGILKKSSSKEQGEEPAIELLYEVNQGKNFDDYQTLNNPPFVPQNERSMARDFPLRNNQPYASQPTSLPYPLTPSYLSATSVGIDEPYEKQESSSMHGFVSSPSSYSSTPGLLNAANLQKHNQITDVYSKRGLSAQTVDEFRLRGIANNSACPISPSKFPMTCEPSQDGTWSIERTNTIHPRFSHYNILRQGISDSKAPIRHPSSTLVPIEKNILAEIRHQQSKNEPTPPPKDKRHLSGSQQDYLHHGPSRYENPIHGRVLPDSEIYLNRAIKTADNSSLPQNQQRIKERLAGNLLEHFINRSNVSLSHSETEPSNAYLRYQQNKHTSTY